MKRILFILFLVISFQSFAQNRFPSIDSAKNYTLRYYRNSTVETFTNLRGQNIAYGTLELIDSLAGNGAVDSIWFTGGSPDTLRYRKAGTTYTVGTISGGGGGSGTVTNFSFTNSTGITGTVTNPTTTPNLSLVIDSGAIANFSSKVRSLVSATYPIQYTSGTGVFSLDTSSGRWRSENYYNTIYLKNITGLVTAGTNISITGSGTSGSPYVINAGGASIDSGGIASRPGSPTFGQRYFQTNELAGWYHWNGRYWEHMKPYDMIFDFTFTVKAYASSPGITLDASGGGDWRSASSIFDQPTNSKFYVHAFAFYTAASTAKSGFRAGPSSTLSNFTRGADSNFVLHTRVGANVLSNATDAYTIYAGANAGDGASDGNGEYFKYTHSNNSGNWQCITKSGAGTTTINTSVPFVAGEAYDLVITYYGDDKVEFFINGVFVGQSTSNFTQRLYDAGAWIQRSAGTGIVYMAADRLKFYRW